MTEIPLTDANAPLPCPFCASDETETVVYEDETNPYLEPVYYVRCRECFAQGSHRDAPDDAERWWNREMLYTAWRDRREDESYG